ncbi:hypothetical protein [Comamonas sp. E6]|jgi:hypothetical protein|uniref:hypothetical protein n=1 Tax=Comamonas sp. E6 TaxID=364029 RepID=UPI000637C52E|nr:hypothetical protein [Comamonas sp. E6]GAO73509.1 hypothetical protein CSE6_041_49460 [Comamonas sp. E6]
MNAREQLIAIADWLGDEEESLSFGLRNAFDALRLYDYALARPELICGYVMEWPEADRIAALGYDPIATVEAIQGRDVNETGATQACAVLARARDLLDSVAFVATEGDTSQLLVDIDDILTPEVQESMT